MITVQVRHDPEQSRFVTALPDGSEAELVYAEEGKRLNFYHTYVPEAYRTEGVAEQVVLAGFAYARKEGYKVVPSCPYVGRAFLRKHPEFQDLIV